MKNYSNKIKRPGNRHFRRSLNISNASNLEYQILANAKIYLREKLSYSLIFKKVSNDNNSIEYQIEKSSIGLDIFLHNDLMNDIINNLQLHPSFQRFPIVSTDLRDIQLGKRILINNRSDFSLSENSNKIYSYLFDHYISYDKEGRNSVIKSYTFNFLSFLFLNNFEYLLILGMDIDNSELRNVQRDIKCFYKNIDIKIKDSFKSLKGIEERSKYYLDPSHRIYSQIIGTFKKILSEDSVDSIHLFSFDAYDRRLYYNFIESMNITSRTLSNYMKMCEIYDSVNNKLSFKQIEYIKKRIKKTINADVCPVNELFDILDNIHDSNWINNYLKNLEPGGDLNDIDERIWKILLVLSSIPQEPWTGVAGYSAFTRTMDISKTGEGKTKFGEKENRWKQSNLNSAHFYHKLMVYETITGVGGEGSLAAFPLLDSGQIIGVLFITKPEGVKDLVFTSATLQRALNIAAMLENFILFKRKNDFNSNVLKTLIADPQGITDPFRIIGNSLPDLFNPLLLIVWESSENNNSKVERPKHIWGFKRNNETDEGLLPMNYGYIDGEFDEGKNLYNQFDNSHFEFVKSCKSTVISEKDIDKSFSIRFYKGYERLTRDKTSIELAKQYSSIAQKIKSGIIYYYVEGDKQTWLVMYFEESELIVNRNLNVLKDKISSINNVLLTNKLLKNLLDLKLASTHEIRGAFLRPLQLYIDSSNEIIKTIMPTLNLSKFSKDFEELQDMMDYCNSNLVPMLTDSISKIDNLTKDESSDDLVTINLFKMMERIWKNQRMTWAKQAKADTLFSYYMNHAQLIYGNPSDNSKIICFYKDGELNEVDHDPLMRLKGINIKFIKENFYKILYALLSNTYNQNILPLQDFLEKTPQRANIYIWVEVKDSFLLFYYLSQGKEMSKDIYNWIQHLFNFVKLTNGKSNVIRPDLYEKYKQIKALKDYDRPHGFGLFNIARYLYSTFSDNGISYNGDLIEVIKSDDKTTTIFKLIFPISN